MSGNLNSGSVNIKLNSTNVDYYAGELVFLNVITFRSNAFEVKSVDGHSSGIIHCEDPKALEVKALIDS